MPIPNKGESKSEYISKCIPYIMKKGTAKSQEQAAAICYSIWEKRANESKIEMLIDKYLNEENWSADVVTHWEPPEGLFIKSAKAIVTALKRAPGGLSKAMARLNFYINRAGSNLSAERKSELEKAKSLIKKMKGSSGD